MITFPVPCRHGREGSCPTCIKVARDRNEAREAAHRRAQLVQLAGPIAGGLATRADFALAEVAYHATDIAEAILAEIERRSKP